MARSTDQTVISRGTRVRARVSGNGDLDIQGFVDGEVSVTGEVIVAAEGLVGASITARRITVRGAVRGDLVADEAVHLEDGARVVGDIRSARIAIAPGALLKGYVQTGAPGSLSAGERRATAKRAEPKPAPRAEPRKVSREEPKPAPSRRRTGVLAIAGGGGRKKGPPPPVVPVLKKGAKGALKKKA